MNLTTDKLLYCFDNEKSNEIIENYRLDKFCLFNDDSVIEGLNKLLKETLKQLKFYKKNDNDDILLYLESIRFLPYLMGNQQQQYNLYENYYKNILNFFHKNKLLLFKKEYVSYKQFLHKKPIMNVRYTTNKVKVNITYYSFNCLRNDFGRYKAEKLMKLKNPDKFDYDYDEINRIINS